MLVIDPKFFVLLCLLWALASIWVIHEIMKPMVLQRLHEGECDHSFTAYKNDPRFSKHNYTFFCSKCGAVRQGGSIKPGFQIAEAPPVKPELPMAKTPPRPRPKPKAKKSNGAVKR